MKLLFILLLTVGCSSNPFKKDNEVQEPTTPTTTEPIRIDILKANLEVKRQFYCSESAGLFQLRRWVHGECDGLGFTALYGIGCPQPFSVIEPFEYLDEPGRYSRDPQPEQCFSENAQRADAEDPNRSPTTDSRDHTLMRLIYMWQYQDLSGLERMISYLNDHDWYLCPENGARDAGVRFSRCKVSPTLKATIFEVYAKLGGDCDAQCKFARAVPQDAICQQGGFELHLEILSILLRGTVQGAINDIQVNCLERATRHSPQNAFFEAVLQRFTKGDYLRAVELLSDEKRFPEYALPTTANYCSEYLYQRDQYDDATGLLSDSWAPCSDITATKSGTDFTFTTTLVLKGLRKP